MSKARLIPAGVPFAQIAHDAIFDPSIDAYAFRVYCSLMKRANDQGRAWPSHRTLANELGIDRGKVARSIAALESEGWVTVGKADSATTGHVQRNVYTVHGIRPNRLFTATGRSEQPVVDNSQTGGSQQPEPVADNGHNNNHKQQPSNNHIAVAGKRRDFAWEWLTAEDGFNLPAITDAQQKRVGRLAREINAALEHDDISDGSRIDELHRRAQSWPAHFPDATLTPEAFAKHMPALGRPPLRGDKRTVEAVLDEQWAREYDARQALEAK